MPRRTLRLLFACSLLTSALVACDDTDDTPGAAVGLDAEADTGGGVTPEDAASDPTMQDTGTEDTTQDADDDADEAGEPDTASDTTSDDADTGAEPDAPDAAVDATPDAVPDTDDATTPDAEPDADPDTDDATTPDAQPDVTPDVAVDTTPDRSCPPSGPFGTRVGDTVAPLSLLTCDGTPYSLHALCDADAAVVVGFAEWCTTCISKAPRFGTMFAQFAREGSDVQGVVIVTQDSSFTTADAADCARVEARFDWGVPVVYDPTQSFRIELTQPANDGALVLDDENALVSTRSGQSVAAIEALVRGVLE